MKYLIAQLYFILFTATIFAQTSQVYKTKDGYHTLTFMNDSAFVYEYFFGFHHSHTEGFYTLKQKNIILESQYSNNLKALDFEVNETTTETRVDSIALTINTNFQDTSIIEIVCILDTLYMSSTLGQIIKVSKHYKNLQVLVKLKDPDRLNFYPLRDTMISSNYSLKDDIKSLEIYWPIDINTFYAETIKGDTLLQKREKIYWPNKSIKLEKVN